MKGEGLLRVVVLACGAAMVIGSDAVALDACSYHTGISQTLVLVSRDWQREFALDRPQVEIVASWREIYRWAKSRAELGDAKAQWAVAEEIIHQRGRDHCGLRDWTEAEAWLRRSAAQG
jgi:TPR repeat protein